MSKGTELIIRALLIAYSCAELIKYKSGYGYYGAWFSFIVWVIIAALDFHRYVIKKEG